ncbi:hypothetical protein LZG71_29765 [Dyadobacter sp. CY312]|nr:hypothetical protein [Dyadobacter sp. CY312]MCE7044605.1 hypothetical protein [Dyadobacter sp. CY312]
MAAAGPERNSSIGILADNIVSTLSKIKNDRIGGPLGENGLARPDLVESKYGGESINFVRAELISMQRIFSKPGNTVGLHGFNWLLDRANAKYGDARLSDAIQAQFTDILIKLNLIYDLEKEVVNNPKQVVDVYESISKLQMLIESDMINGLNFSD